MEFFMQRERRIYAVDEGGEALWKEIVTILKLHATKETKNLKRICLAYV